MVRDIFWNKFLLCHWCCYLIDVGATFGSVFHIEPAGSDDVGEGTLRSVVIASSTATWWRKNRKRLSGKKWSSVGNQVPNSQLSLVPLQLSPGSSVSISVSPIFWVSPTTIFTRKEYPNYQKKKLENLYVIWCHRRIRH